LPLVRGAAEADERVVLVEGRGTRSILAGQWHLLSREGAAQTTTIGDKTVSVAEELFDLDDDPGERRDLAHEKPDVLVEMRARLEAAKTNVAVAGTQAAARPDSAPGPGDGVMVHLRFAGGGRARRIAGWVEVREAKARILSMSPVGAPAEAARAAGTRIELAMTTAPDALVGIDVRAEPPNAPLAWELFVDDAPLAPTEVFAGPFGFAAPALKSGILTDEARTVAFSPVLPQIDLARDLGVFVTRERPGDATSAPERELTPEGKEEVSRLLREWGYARGASGPKPTPKVR
jgi:hypothetical protein